MFKIVLIFLFSIALSECGSWRGWSASSGDVPGDSVLGGYDKGRPYYVIRANHGGGVLPGKYSPDLRQAYVSFGNHEVQKSYFEILTGNEFIWSNANDERSLVTGGSSASGDTLYICRVSIGNSQVPGKLHNGRCFVPYGGREVGRGNWDTLKFR